MSHRSLQGCLRLIIWGFAVASGLSPTIPARADQQKERPAKASRHVVSRIAAGETADVWESVPAMRVVLPTGEPRHGPSLPTGGPRGGCIGQQALTYAEPEDFEGGTYLLQGGFVETEIAAASYTIDPSHFPIKIELMEMVFGTQNAAVQTVTHWSVMVWDGFPNTGALVASFSSDDIILPHLRLGPGNAGTNIQVSVDPEDPDQIYVYNDGQTDTFSIGYRIDQHNQPATEPCYLDLLPAHCCPPPSIWNAFPAADFSGVANPLNNWLYAREDCGPLAPGGWFRFSAPYELPSGDWVLRATYSCTSEPAGACCSAAGCFELSAAECGTAGGDFQGEGTLCATADICDGACCIGGNCTVSDEPGCAGAFHGVGVPCAAPDPCSGACCLADGGCADGQTQTTCDALGGVYRGDGSECGGLSCLGACCLTGGACGDLTKWECDNDYDGAWQGPDTDCATYDCPTVAACCMADGSCQDDLTQPNCQAAGGVFMAGDICSAEPCVGACCFDTGTCLDRTLAVCDIYGAVWQGPATQCLGDQCPTAPCCMPDGQCIEDDTIIDCLAAGGQFMEGFSNCIAANCPQPTGACCLSNGSCLPETQGDCNIIPGSAWAGPNTQCNGAECPPAPCCLPAGTCIEDSDFDDCALVGGTFMTGSADCPAANCPAASGACCLSSGACLPELEADCVLIPGATWAGPGTDCADDNSNGTADACEADPCQGVVFTPGDVNDDTSANGGDIEYFVEQFMTPTPGSVAFCAANMCGGDDLNSDDMVAFVGCLLDPQQCGVSGPNCP